MQFHHEVSNQFPLVAVLSRPRRLVSPARREDSSRRPSCHHMKIRRLPAQPDTWTRGFCTPHWRSAWHQPPSTGSQGSPRRRGQGALHIDGDGEVPRLIRLDRDRGCFPARRPWAKRDPARRPPGGIPLRLLEAGDILVTTWESWKTVKLPSHFASDNVRDSKPPSRPCSDERRNHESVSASLHVGWLHYCVDSARVPSSSEDVDGWFPSTCVGDND